MDKIQKTNYSNLRAEFHSLVSHIMGESYYTTAMDVYSSDIECCDAMKRRYSHMKASRNWYKNLSIILCIISLGLLVCLVIALSK